MRRFVESIRVENNAFQNLIWHNKRFNETRQKVFGMVPAGQDALTGNPVDLNDLITLPDWLDKGVYKCRVVYDREILQIDFIPYVPRVIRTLRLVEAPDLDYSLKFEDREALNALFEGRGEADDILVTQHGFITDTSFSNVVFYDGRNWLTPTTFLLNGTRRQAMLAEGIIRETTIQVSDLRKFKEVRLINSMLDFRENDSSIMILPFLPSDLT
ncbi:MAG: aminotransferase class IV [Bacteroidales bacterium]|jgi:4-amino-4-deoxychorismate lyase